MHRSRFNNMGCLTHLCLETRRKGASYFLLSFLFRSIANYFCLLSRTCWSFLLVIIIELNTISHVARKKIRGAQVAWKIFFEDEIRLQVLFYENNDIHRLVPSTPNVQCMYPTGFSNCEKEKEKMRFESWKRKRKIAFRIMKKKNLREWVHS